jgi:hypothetical protein
MVLKRIKKHKKYSTCISEIEIGSGHLFCRPLDCILQIIMYVILASFCGPSRCLVNFSLSVLIWIVQRDNFVVLELKLRMLDYIC